MNCIEELAKKLSTEKWSGEAKWSLETARLSIRAGHRCEYCGLDFLESVHNYRLFEVDHIVPKGEPWTEAEENKAVACRVCNSWLKHAYDPREGEVGLSREELIFRARRHISAKRAEVAAEIEFMKSLIFSKDR